MTTTNKTDNLNKRLYKLTILTLKFLPVVMASAFMISNLIHIKAIQIIAHVIGINAAQFLFIYLTSHVFKFCNYHRIFIHYLVLKETINLIDWYIGIPISDKAIQIVHIVIAVIFIVIAVKMYYNKNIKCIKNKDYDK
jgi:hypothetical protein